MTWKPRPVPEIGAKLRVPVGLDNPDTMTATVRHVDGAGFVYFHETGKRAIMWHDYLDGMQENSTEGGSNSD